MISWDKKTLRGKLTAKIFYFKKYLKTPEIILTGILT
jgi:hypothetical protein